MGKVWPALKSRLGVVFSDTPHWAAPAVLLLTLIITAWTWLAFDAAGDTQKANIVLAGGFVTALLLFLVVNSQAILLFRARRLAQEMTAASHESERQTRAIIATASDAFVAIDEKGVIREWNVKAEKVFGWSATEAIGSLLAERIIPATQREAHRLGLARFLETGESPVIDRRIELTALRRDGTEFPIELTIWATESGGRRRFNAFIADPSERKRAESEIKRAHERLDLALKASNLALFEWNIATGEVYLSEEWSRIVGAKNAPTHTTFAALESLVHPEDKPMLSERIAAALKGTYPYYETEHRIETPAHEWKWIHSIGKIIERDGRGRALRMIGTNEDISERKRTEQELIQAHKQLIVSVQELEQRNRENLFLSELNNVLQSCTTLGEAFEPIVKTGAQLFPHDDGVLYFAGGSHNQVEAAAFWGNPIVLEKSRGPVECWSLRRGRLHRVDNPATGHLCGHVLPESAKPYICIPLVAQNTMLGFIHLSRRETSSPPFEEKSARLAGALAEQVSLALTNLRLRETLRHESHHDPLTGLYNRRYLENAAHYELSRVKRKKNGVLSAVILDIDHFKQYNDKFGHAAGDVALQAVGALLRAKSRDYDVPCRYGGEEFVIILPDTSVESALKWAEKFRQSVAEFGLKHEGRLLDSITVSMGVAGYPEHANNEKELLKAADQALYAAKANGRNQVVAYVAAIARFGDPVARTFSDG
ncbi:MAG: sensor domain-containing diguanylate cyclase [Burkholderiales bacterium]